MTGTASAIPAAPIKVQAPAVPAAPAGGPADLFAQMLAAVIGGLAAGEVAPEVCAVEGAPEPEGGAGTAKAAEDWPAPASENAAAALAALFSGARDVQPAAYVDCGEISADRVNPASVFMLAALGGAAAQARAAGAAAQPAAAPERVGAASEAAAGDTAAAASEPAAAPPPSVRPGEAPAFSAAGMERAGTKPAETAVTEKTTAAEAQLPPKPEASGKEDAVRERSRGSAAESRPAAAEDPLPPAQSRPEAPGEGGGQGRAEQDGARTGQEAPGCGREKARQAAPEKIRKGQPEVQPFSAEARPAAPPLKETEAAQRPASDARALSAAGIGRIVSAACGTEPGGRLSFELNGEAFGRVRVEVAVSGGEVSVRLNVESEEAGRALSARSADLMDALSQRGLNAGVEVFSGADGGRRGEREAHGRAKRRQRAAAAEAAVPERAPAAQEEGRLSIYA